MRSYIRFLKIIGALALSITVSESSAQDVTADTPHCTVTAFAPSGTPSKVVFGGTYHCDRPVPRFRLLVSINSHYTNNNMDDWSDGYGTSQDFTNGEISGYTQFDGAVTPPIEMRTHVWGYILDKEDDDHIIFVGNDYSGTVEFN